jgi:periplasmic protein TonB
MATPVIAEVPLRQPPPLPLAPPRSVVAAKSSCSGPIFNEALLERHHFKSTSKAVDLFLAFLVHAIVIGGPILAGLYYTDTINLRAFTATQLVAPPPPPPPPAAVASIIKTQHPRRIFTSAGKLVAPTYIPHQVAQIKEAPLESDALDGVTGGVPGGVPGGQLGGVIGGVLSSVSRTNVPVPVATPSKPRAPVRVGGRIRPPRAVLQPAPAYPVLAKQTRLQGVVLIDAVIDAEGNVVEMHVVSGHPLLISAALEAVKKWKYEPTYLNDQAIPVQLVVTVTFQLNQ